VVRNHTDPLDPLEYVHRDGRGQLSLSDRPMLYRNRSVAKKVRQRSNRSHRGYFCERPFADKPGYYVQARCSETGNWVDVYSAPFETLADAQDVISTCDRSKVRLRTDPVTDPFTDCNQINTDRGQA
jgi:hypothetical protein